MLPGEDVDVELGGVDGALVEVTCYQCEVLKERKEREEREEKEEELLRPACRRAEGKREEEEESGHAGC